MKKLNLINKLLTIILVSLVVLLTNNDMVFLVLASIGVIYSLYSRKNFLIIFFIIAIIGYIIRDSVIVIDDYKIYDWILVIDLFFLIVSTFTTCQRRYIFDKTMYRLRDYRRTKNHLKHCYYDQCLNKNIDNMSKYNNFINSKFLNKQAIIKTNKDLDDIYLLYKLRFYQIYNKKNPLFPDKWKKADTIYLLMMVTAFCMMVCIG